MNHICPNTNLFQSNSNEGPHGPTSQKPQTKQLWYLTRGHRELHHHHNRNIVVVVVGGGGGRGITILVSIWESCYCGGSVHDSFVERSSVPPILPWGSQRRFYHQPISSQWQRSLHVWTRQSLQFCAWPPHTTLPSHQTWPP